MLIALGIDLVIASVVLYVFGAAAQSLDRNVLECLFFALSIACMLAAPWFIVLGI